MALFEKKICDICGDKIGLLGNRKLDDGNLCKECAKKLSPWFEERRHSTVDAIREQLAYREANKAKVSAFQVTREFVSDRYHVFIDDTKGQFAIAYDMDVEENPDIMDLSQVISCRLDIKQNSRKEQYRDSEGKLQDYVPPRYKYSYDYSIKLAVSSPWFDDMDFDLSTFAIEEHERQKNMEMESTGNEIVAALTGRPMMNNGFGQSMGMQNNGYGQPMNQGMQNNGYGQPMNQGMQNNGYGQPMNQGMQNNGYGQPMNQGMQNNGYAQSDINGFGYSQMNNVRCNSCGWQPTDPNQIPKFCPQCGSQLG